MALLAYPFEVRDSTNTTTDNRKTGLTPTVGNGKTIAASPATVSAGTVTVVEIVGGHYAALYDAEANGDASFPIDAGAGLSSPNDRYITLDLLRDSGRVLASLGETGAIVATNGDKSGYALAAAGLDQISAAAPSHGSLGSWTFPQVLLWLVRRFRNKATRSPTQIIVYADDEATVLSTQAISDDGAGNEVQGGGHVTAHLTRLTSPWPPFAILGGPAPSPPPDDAWIVSRGRFRLEISAKHEDRVERHRLLSLMVNLAKATLNGQSLADVTFPMLTILRRSGKPFTRHPYQVQPLDGEYEWAHAGFASFDLTSTADSHAILEDVRARLDQTGMFGSVIGYEEEGPASSEWGTLVRVEAGEGEDVDDADQ